MRFSPRLHVRERNPGCLQRFLPLLLCSRAQELGGGAGTGAGGGQERSVLLWTRGKIDLTVPRRRVRCRKPEPVRSAPSVLLALAGRRSSPAHWGERSKQAPPIFTILGGLRADLLGCSDDVFLLFDVHASDRALAARAQGSRPPHAAASTLAASKQLRTTRLFADYIKRRLPRLAALAAELLTDASSEDSPSFRPPTV